MKEPRFEVLPEMDLVGLTISTYPLGHSKNDPMLIPQLWDFLMQVVGATGTEVSGPMYGAQIMDGESLSYLAGFESDADFPGAEKWLLPESKYAIFEHVGSLETLDQTFHFIFNEWFPANVARIAPTPLLEIYDDRFVPESPDSLMLIAVPIES
jgi:AraC family transcriptional regulator